MTADAAVVLFKALIGVVAFVTDNEGKIGEALSMMEQETGNKNQPARFHDHGLQSFKILATA